MRPEHADARELTRILERCQERRVRLMGSLLGESINPSLEEAREIVQMEKHEEQLLALALEARKLAHSYRNFDVGAAAIGLRRIQQPGATPWHIRFAANTKEEGADKKYCGEQRLMDGMLRKRWLHWLLVAVAGEPQADHGSGKMGKTLHPCEVCRWRIRGLMKEYPNLIRPDMRILTVHCTHPHIVERMTLAELHEFHGETL